MWDWGRERWIWETGIQIKYEQNRTEPNKTKKNVHQNNLLLHFFMLVVLFCFLSFIEMKYYL